MLFLSCSGARTILDKILLETVGDAGTFSQKIDKMIDKDFISDSEKEILSTLIDAGSASIHRGWKPSFNQIIDIFDSIESIFYRLFILPKITGKLKQNIPPRKK